MKILFVLAIIFAVAHARLQAAITYKGSADCSDATKIVLVDLSNEAQCTEAACKIDLPGQSTVTRCFDTVDAVPIPKNNVVTVFQYNNDNCGGEVTRAGYAVIGIDNCVGAVATTTSIYFPSCGNFSQCNFNTDCSACQTAAITCSTAGKAFCGVDTTPFIATPGVAPVSIPASGPTVPARAGLRAIITYSGSADCSDTSKIIRVEATNEAQCTEEACKIVNGQQTVTRCYNNINDVPIPNNSITNLIYPAIDCVGDPTAAVYRVIGLPGCLLDADNDYEYYPACGNYSVCSGNSCSSCETNIKTIGKCFLMTKHVCGVDKAPFPAPPVSAPSSSTPLSAPTTKKSFASSLQVFSGVSAALVVAIALIA